MGLLRSGRLTVVTVQNKLLILDLDETLLYATAQPPARPADFAVGDYYVYKRPHVDAFLTQCFDWFDVAVWTSASPSYAVGIG
jgi:TFIIF-interacting CTD phosphatase-like protein